MVDFQINRQEPHMNNPTRRYSKGWAVAAGLLVLVTGGVAACEAAA